MGLSSIWNTLKNIDKKATSLVKTAYSYIPGLGAGVIAGNIIQGKPSEVKEVAKKQIVGVAVTGAAIGTVLGVSALKKVPLAKQQNAMTPAKVSTQNSSTAKVSSTTSTVKGVSSAPTSGGSGILKKATETTKKIAGTLGSGSIADKVETAKTTLGSITPTAAITPTSALGSSTPKRATSTRKHAKKKATKRRKKAKKSSKRRSRKKRYGSAKQYARKGGKSVKYTKNGQPYIILRSGKARFIKGRRRKR